ncbi:hypothetical protein [Actinoplanes solisilvae]|uniref:hypothetical protein n=1 Tax=Actinoplanes solisilvae TaxID=2486853 RepID=UPI0013E2BBEF|nr:hypothetical protein [Actinoplanes solisilvae]
MERLGNFCTEGYDAVSRYIMTIAFGLTVQAVNGRSEGVLAAVDVEVGAED